MPVWETDLTGPLALVVGSERYGVSDTWRCAADRAVAIPMPGPVDSVNVAVAAGIVLFEAVRQRAQLARPVERLTQNRHARGLTDNGL